MTAGREVERRPLDAILTDQDQRPAAVSWKRAEKQTASNREKTKKRSHR